MTWTEPEPEQKKVTKNLKNLKNLNLIQGSNITRTAPSPRPAPETKDRTRTEPEPEPELETEAEPEPENTDLASYRNNQKQTTGPEPAENQTRTST